VIIINNHNLPLSDREKVWTCASESFISENGEAVHLEGMEPYVLVRYLDLAM